MPMATYKPFCYEHGLPMELRSGKYGEFWGCPNYRSLGCKETRSLSAHPAESPRIAWVDATSERPIAITWRLEHELPGDIFASYRAA